MDKFVRNTQPFKTESEKKKDNLNRPITSCESELTIIIKKMCCFTQKDQDTVLQNNSSRAASVGHSQSIRSSQLKPRHYGTKQAMPAMPCQNS